VSAQFEWLVSIGTSDQSTSYLVIASLFVATTTFHASVSSPLPLHSLVALVLGCTAPPPLCSLPLSPTITLDPFRVSVRQFNPSPASDVELKLMKLILEMLQEVDPLRHWLAGTTNIPLFIVADRDLQMMLQMRRSPQFTRRSRTSLRTSTFQTPPL
jgi:hypothetical protein